MNKINDGGPAFGHGDHQHGGSAGMSLRDWFAGQALQGMLAHATRYRPRPEAPANWHDAIAEEAYEIADAMLAAQEAAD